MTDTAQPDSVGLYTQRDVCRLGSFSKSHLHNMIREGRFPPPCLRLGVRFTRWSAKDVNEWLADPKAWIAAAHVAEQEAA